MRNPFALNPLKLNSCASIVLYLIDIILISQIYRKEWIGHKKENVFQHSLLKDYIR